MADRRRRKICLEESEDETSDLNTTENDTISSRSRSSSRLEDSEYESATDETDDTQDEDTLDEDTLDEDDSEDGSCSDIIIEDGLDEERQSGDGEEQPNSTKLDDDEDTKNPAYVPRKGQFYFHDQRLAEQEYDKQTEKAKKKLWLDECKWLHDRYVEAEQMPKSQGELIALYGYDITTRDKPPDAPPPRRGRGNPRERRNKLTDFLPNTANVTGSGDSSDAQFARRNFRGNDRDVAPNYGRALPDNINDNNRNNHPGRFDGRRGRGGPRNQAARVNRYRDEPTRSSFHVGLNDSNEDHLREVTTERKVEVDGPKQGLLQTPGHGGTGLNTAVHSAVDDSDGHRGRQMPEAKDNRQPKVNHGTAGGDGEDLPEDIGSGVVLTIETGPGRAERRGNSYGRDRKGRGGYVRDEPISQDVRTSKDGSQPHHAGYMDSRNRGAAPNKSYGSNIPPRLQPKTSPDDQTASTTTKDEAHMRPKRYSTQRQRPAAELPYPASAELSYPEMDIATRSYTQSLQHSQTFYNKGGYPSSIYQPADGVHDQPGEVTAFPPPPVISQRPPLAQYAPMSQNNLAMSPPAISNSQPHPHPTSIVMPNAQPILSRQPPYIQPSNSSPATVVQGRIGQFYATPTFGMPIQYAAPHPVNIPVNAQIMRQMAPQIQASQMPAQSSNAPQQMGPRVSLQRPINTQVPPPVQRPIHPQIVPPGQGQISPQVPTGQVGPLQVVPQVPPPPHQLTPQVQAQVAPLLSQDQPLQEVRHGGTTYYSTQLQQAAQQSVQKPTRRHRTAIPIVDPQELSPYDYTVPDYYQQVINQHGQVVAQFAYSSSPSATQLNPDQPVFMSRQQQPLTAYIVSDAGEGSAPVQWGGQQYVLASLDETSDVATNSDLTYIEEDSTAQNSSFEEDRPRERHIEMTDSAADYEGVSSGIHAFDPSGDNPENDVDERYIRRDEIDVGGDNYVEYCDEDDQRGFTESDYPASDTAAEVCEDNEDIYDREQKGSEDYEEPNIEGELHESRDGVEVNSSSENNKGYSDDENFINRATNSSDCLENGDSMSTGCRELRDASDYVTSKQLNANDFATLTIADASRDVEASSETANSTVESYVEISTTIEPQFVENSTEIDVKFVEGEKLIGPIK